MRTTGRAGDGLWFAWAFRPVRLLGPHTRAREGTRTRVRPAAISKLDPPPPGAVPPRGARDVSESRRRRSPDQIARIRRSDYKASVTRRRTFRAFVFAWLVLLSSGLASLPAAAKRQSREVRVIPTADARLARARVKPPAVEWLMSGDYMTGLRWHRWGASRADAVGVYNLNLCNPCATGHVRHAPGRLTLSAIRSCRGVRLYTVAKATYFTRGRWRVTTGLGQPTDPCSP